MSTSTQPSQQPPASPGAGSRLRDYIARGYERFGELIRFVGVGGTAFVIDTGLFNIFLLVLDWPWAAAKILATVIATTAAFLGNRHWTWRSRRSGNLHRQYTLYFLFNGIGLLIALGCLWANDGLAAVWPEYFGNPIAQNAANILGVGVASVFRFYAYRTWVFRPVRV